MKYTLLKKWHPNQIEEVGHVFEEDERDLEIEYTVKNKKRYTQYFWLRPNEIALLCHAGYLEKIPEGYVPEKVEVVGERPYGKSVFPHSHLVHGQTFDCEKGQDGSTDWGRIIIQDEKCHCGQYLLIHSLPMCEKPKPSLDLWENEPPEGTECWYVSDLGTVWCTSFLAGTKADMFRLRTNNCHKTKQSAEEALRRLMEE